MWNGLDFYDKALVGLTQRELLEEAEHRRLVRQARGPRRGILDLLTARHARRADNNPEHQAA